MWRFSCHTSYEQKSYLAFFHDPFSRSASLINAESQAAYWLDHYWRS